MIDIYNEIVFAYEDNWINGSTDYSDVIYDGYIDMDSATRDNILQGQSASPEFSTHVKLSELPGGTQYIYFVQIRTHDYFVNMYSTQFNKFNPRVVHDLRSNKCKLVFCCEQESTSGGSEPMDFAIIQKWLIDKNIPGNNVIYVTGNMLAEQLFRDSVSYKIYSVSMLESWITHNASGIVEYNPTEENHIYLNFNRQPRDHRLWLLTELLHNNLLDKGLNSFNFSSIQRINIHNYDQSLEDSAKILYDMHERVIDVDTTNNLADNINKLLFDQTFMSMVTETSIHDKALQFSEKVWKPILVGHPFQLFATSGSLELLRSYGYLTFSEWMDESYDTTSSNKKKIEIFMKNIKKFAEYDVESLKAIRKEMIPVLRYNQALFNDDKRKRFSNGSQMIARKPLLDIIARSWCELCSHQK